MVTSIVSLQVYWIKVSLETAQQDIHNKFGSIDILVNGLVETHLQQRQKVEKMEGN